MKPTRGNSSPKWNSTLATTRRAVLRLAAWYRKLLYQTTGLWLGRPTGRVSNSAMSRSRPFGRNADSVLHASRLQRLVDLRLGEDRVGAKHDFLAQLLLPLDLGQEQFFPVVGTVDVAGPQFCRQAVALAVEQQQRVIAGGFEVAVVGAVLLLAVNRDLGRVHVQHDPLRGIHGFCLADEFPVNAGQPGEVLLLGQHLGFERLQA